MEKKDGTIACSRGFATVALLTMNVGSTPCTEQEIYGSSILDTRLLFEKEFTQKLSVHTVTTQST